MKDPTYLLLFLAADIDRSEQIAPSPYPLVSSNGDNPLISCGRWSVISLAKNRGQEACKNRVERNSDGRCCTIRPQRNGDLKHDHLAVYTERRLSLPGRKQYNDR